MIQEMYIEWKELWRNGWYVPGSPEYRFILAVLIHLDQRCAHTPYQTPERENVTMGFFDIESGPSVKFNKVGDTVTGTISEPYDIRQANDFATGKPKFDDADRPVMMAVITLSTTQRDPSISNDDGTRVVYAEKFGLRKAIASAVKDTGAADLEVGGQLTVTYTGDSPSNKGFPLKNWSAQYVRAGGIMAAAEASTLPAGATITATGNPDIVAIARAAQEKARADQAAMQAKSAAPANGNGNGAAADMGQIKQLAGMGFDAAAIHAAMPAYSMDAITAVLAL